MASTNSDQENVLLPSDEESPSAPLPAGRLPIKALLAAGLCLAAAGLAGAAVMRKQATHAPPKIRPPWADTISLAKETGVNFDFGSEECNNNLEAQHKEATETGRKLIGQQGELPDCKDSEQFCRVKATISGAHKMSQTGCFPITCKQENVLKAFENIRTLTMPDGTVVPHSDVHVTCVKNVSELPKERKKWKTYLSQECHDRIEALEKEVEESEESGRKPETENEVPVCKDDQGLCIVDITPAQGHPHFRKVQDSHCFPAICKQENIQKGLLEDIALANVFQELKADLDFHCYGLQGAGIRLSSLSFSVVASGSLIFIASI
jgi:hypothetical protein